MTDTTEEAPKGILMSNRTYNVLKDLTMIILPAVSLFYVTLSTIWGFPYVTEIVATIAAVIVLLGAVLKISGIRYQNVKRVEEALATTPPDSGLLRRDLARD